jgi:hypothetical protein
MFESDTLVEFEYNEYDGNNKNKELFYFIITSTPYYIDISIFTIEEWEKLELIHKRFRDQQIILENETDYNYSRMFDRTNLNYEKNRHYETSIYWLDRELYRNFGVKFKELDPNCEDKKNLKVICETIPKIFKYEEKQYSKDKLRKWFVDNYNVLQEHLKVCEWIVY